MFLAARNKINPTHRITDAARKCVATENESPIPVQTATYAARHSGHFGSSARIAPGMIQLAISRPCRKRDTGRRALSPARVLIWQHWRAFTRAPPWIRSRRSRTLATPSPASKACPRRRTRLCRNDHGAGPIPSRSPGGPRPGPWAPGQESYMCQRVDRGRAHRWSRYGRRRRGRPCKRR